MLNVSLPWLVYCPLPLLNFWSLAYVNIYINISVLPTLHRQVQILVLYLCRFYYTGLSSSHSLSGRNGSSSLLPGPQMCEKLQKTL
uniref:Uncharacterized protein n=1 Tax=Neogobius melanostomus TaxID=47308 RepID=A0A8C6WP13_9GOBI